MLISATALHAYLLINTSFYKRQVRKRIKNRKSILRAAAMFRLGTFDPHGGALPCADNPPHLFQRYVKASMVHGYQILSDSADTYA